MLPYKKVTILMQILTNFYVGAWQNYKLQDSPTLYADQCDNSCNPAHLEEDNFLSFN